eukprot:scaffold7938_cov286-Pinguiococcus_pyrenoidosus.AAC.3
MIGPTSVKYPRPNDSNWFKGSERVPYTERARCPDMGRDWLTVSSGQPYYSMLLACLVLPPCDAIHRRSGSLSNCIFELSHFSNTYSAIG